MKLVSVVFVCATIVVVFLSVLFHIIAMSSSYWIVSSEPNGGEVNFLNIGLHSACFHDYRHPHERPVKVYDGCAGLSSDTYSTIRDWLVPSWLVSARVMSVFALIIQLVGCVLFVLFLLWAVLDMICCSSKSVCATILIYATPIVYTIAGVFVMMPVMIFGDNAFRLQCNDFWLEGGDPFSNELGWSWYMEVFATILTFIGAIMLVVCVVTKARGKA